MAVENIEYLDEVPDMPDKCPWPDGRTAGLRKFWESGAPAMRLTLSSHDEALRERRRVSVTLNTYMGITGDEVRLRVDGDDLYVVRQDVED